MDAVSILQLNVTTFEVSFERGWDPPTVVRGPRQSGDPYTFPSLLLSSLLFVQTEFLSRNRSLDIESTSFRATFFTFVHPFRRDPRDALFSFSISSYIFISRRGGSKRTFLVRSYGKVFLVC